MAIRRVLSVDTAYESDLRWFANARAGLYDEIGGQIDVRQLGQIDANRDTLLRLCECRLNRGDRARNVRSARFLTFHLPKIGGIHEGMHTHDLRRV